MWVLHPDKPWLPKLIPAAMWVGGRYKGQRKRGRKPFPFFLPSHGVGLKNNVLSLFSWAYFTKSFIYYFFFGFRSEKTIFPQDSFTIELKPSIPFMLPRPTE